MPRKYFRTSSSKIFSSRIPSELLIFPLSYDQSKSLGNFPAFSPGNPPESVDPSQGVRLHHGPRWPRGKRPPRAAPGRATPCPARGCWRVPREHRDRFETVETKNTGGKIMEKGVIQGDFHGISMVFNGIYGDRNEFSWDRSGIVSTRMFRIVWK